MAFPHATVVELQPEVKSQLRNSVADATHIDTQNLRKCTVSTTVNDVQYGRYVDSRDGISHEACVCFFRFEFGRQNKGQDQRISDIDIKLSVFRPPPSGKAIPSGAVNTGYPMGSPSQTSSSNSAAKGTQPSWEIRLHEPKNARAKPSNLTVTSGWKIGGDLGYAPIAGVTGSVQQNSQQKVFEWGRLTSGLESKRVMYWHLKENTMLKDGVPEAFECALVLRTDGLPFSIAADFEAKLPMLRGISRWTAKAQVLVGEQDLRHELSKGEDETTGLGDMDSEVFLKWMRSKVENEWIDRS